MVLGPTLHEQSVRGRMPGRPGFESRRGRQQVHGYNCSTTVPRSLGGQDSRFSLSLSTLCGPRHAHTHHLFRKEASTLGLTF